MTFDELANRCTPAERDKLAWHLAMMRARATYDALRPPDAGAAPISAMLEETRP